MRNKKIYFLLSIILALNLCLFIQNVYADGSISIEWTKSWGGKKDEVVHGLALDPSGNIYIGGYTWSFGAGKTDLCLVKYNNSGDLQWNTTWGGIKNDYGYDVATDSSGNVYFVGLTYSFGAQGGDVCILKYDSSGIWQWNTTWGEYLIQDVGRAIAIDSSDNIYIAGYTYTSEPFNAFSILLKYDSSGNLIWNRTWSRPDLRIYCYTMTIDSSDNIYLGGICLEQDVQHSIVSIALAKYDSSGNFEWDRYWAKEQKSYCTDLTASSSGNIYLTGYVGYYDMCLAKYDASGSLQWDKDWDIGGGKAIAVDSLENIYVVGITHSLDALFIKFDNQGTPLFNVTWGENTVDYGAAIAVDASDNIFIAQNSKDFIYSGPSTSDTNSDDTGEDFFLIKIINVPDATTIPGFDILFIIGLIYIVSGIISSRYRKLISKAPSN